VKIFVSYSRRDAGDFADQIQRHLSTFNYDIFTDVNSIRVGEIWSNTIETNISTCDIFVVIVTHGALQSPHVEREVLQARKENKKIIPCFFRGIRKDKIKWGLDKIQGIEFSDKYELARELYSKIENYPNLENEKQNNLNLEQVHLNSIQKTDFDNFIIDGNSLDYHNLLKEPSKSEIEQIIYEIESSNNEEREQKFNELEDLARYKRLYNKEKILVLCDKYLLSNNDYSLLSRVLDFVKRLLSTSIEIDGSNDFLNYVRSKYSEKFKEIILSTEKEHRDAQNYVRQILEWYGVLDNDIINKLYWQSIKNHVQVENLEISEFQKCISPYFNKIKQSDDFKLKCRSEIYEMTKLNNEKIKERAKLLMKLFRN
jgi:hypothetical protein